MNKAAILALQSVLKEARRTAKGLPSAKKAAIEKMCVEIDELAKELAELQAAGQVCLLLWIHQLLWIRLLLCIVCCYGYVYCYAVVRCVLSLQPLML